MNKARRAALDKLQDRITAAKVGMEALQAEVEQIKDELEALRDEEQDAYDNLPESLQQGEKGQDMEAAIGSMDSGIDGLQEIADALAGELLDEAVSNIEDAKGQA